MLPLLQTLLFAGHLLCVNVAGAGPLVCLWFEWREGRGDVLAGRAGRYLAGVSLILFLAGMLLGVALGVTLYNRAYHHTLWLVGSRVYFGLWELVFSLVLMALHWAWWRGSPTPPAWQRAARALLPLLSSTNLLYHFPFLFAIVAQLSSSGQEGETPLSSADFRGRMADGLILAQVVHFWLASLASVGIVLLGYALRLSRQADSQIDSNRVATWGGRIALVCTLLQIPVGLWLLSQLPAEAQSRIVGGNLVSTALFGAAILAAVWLLHQLAAVALGDTQRPPLLRAMAALVLVVVLMSGTLLAIKSAL